jgi:hypothetical protein
VHAGALVRVPATLGGNLPSARLLKLKSDPPFFNTPTYKSTQRKRRDKEGGEREERETLRESREGEREREKHLRPP